MFKVGALEPVYVARIVTAGICAYLLEVQVGRN